MGVSITSRSRCLSRWMELCLPVWNLYPSDRSDLTCNSPPWFEGVQPRHRDLLQTRKRQTREEAI